MMIIGKKDLNSISTGLFKRLESFKKMSNDTVQDIKVLADLKKTKSVTIQAISTEIENIDKKVEEAEGFVTAINKMFGFASDKENN